MFEQIAPEVQSTVVTLVLALLGLLSSFLIACAKKLFDWLGTKVDSMKSDSARKAVNDALSDLHELVNTTVTSLQQTLAKDIKESIAANDGRFTYDDLLALKDKAFESIKAQMTVSATEALSSVYADVDAFIMDLIEKSVYNLKNQIVVSEGVLVSE